MQTAMEELELSISVWRDAIAHRQQKIAAKLRGEEFDDGIDADFDEPDDSVGEMHRDITIYRLCIDWAHDQQDLLLGRFSEATAMHRQRFYKLMTVLAKAEVDRDDHLRSVAFVSSPSADHATNQEAVEELELTATRSLEALVGKTRAHSERAEYTGYSPAANHHSDSRFSQHSGSPSQTP